MFTREDYIRYFEELAHVERKMIYLVNDTIAQLNDKRILHNLERVAADEAKHYSFILDLLATHLEFNEHGEHRLNARAHTLGPVDLEDLESSASGAGFRGYCSNLSKTGMCLESAKSFRPGERYSLKMKPYDPHGPVLERKGRVVWAREILDFYIGGIKFEP
jgi:hypothetical protein